MGVFDFPQRPRTGRDRTAARAYDLARQMVRARQRQRTLAAERKRLLEALGRLERLAREMEAIQVDLERLHSALRRGPHAD